MKNKRSLFIKIAALAIILAVAVVMFIIGRGHTVFIDNKTIEYEGESYSACNKVTLFVNGEKITKLAKRERGKVTNMGQDFSMTLEIVREKGDDPETLDLNFTLPYSWDGIVISVPALLNELPQDVIMTEYVAQQTAAEEEEEEEIITDEFALGDF